MTPFTYHTDWDGVYWIANMVNIFKEGNGDSWKNYNINFIDKGISIITMTNSENGEKYF